MIWQALIPVIGTVLEKVLPDPQASADAKIKLMELAQKGELAVLDAETKLALGQLEVNKVEAGTDMFRGAGVQ
jgi:Holin of 3TMs, for gene-transfer release